jgi:hypothetical protein
VSTEEHQPIITKLNSSIDSSNNDELNHLDDDDRLTMLNRHLRGKMKQILLTFDGRGGASRGVQDWALPGNIEKATAAISIWKSDGGEVIAAYVLMVILAFVVWKLRVLCLMKDFARMEEEWQVGL